MLTRVDLDPTNLVASAQEILAAWETSLVLHIRCTQPLDQAQIRDTYERLLPLIGRPCYLAESSHVGDRANQRTGELWTEVRYDPSIPDAYRHSLNAQPLHTDGSYVASYPNATLMFCLASARAGGETVFISADNLVSALRRESPALLSRLESTTIPHRRSGDERSLPVIRRDPSSDEIRLNWNYYCVDENAQDEIQSLRQDFFEYLQSSASISSAVKGLALRPGEAVAWKDERLLHGRNAFVAQEVSERLLWKAAVNIGEVS